MRASNRGDMPILYRLPHPSINEEPDSGSSYPNYPPIPRMSSYNYFSHIGLAYQSKGNHDSTDRRKSPAPAEQTCLPFRSLELVTI
jgi:hypothetical protein